LEKDKIIEVDGPALKLYEGYHQVGDKSPYSGKRLLTGRSLPTGIPDG
jgi:hypothetical protein